MRKLLPGTLLGCIIIFLLTCCGSKYNKLPEQRNLIDSLHHEARGLMHSNPKQALKLSRLIIKESETDSINLAKGLQLQGVALKYLNHEEEALKSALTAEQIFTKIECRELLPDCFNLLGNIYFNLNDIEKAKKYYEKCYKADSLASDTLQMVGDLLNLSNCWLKQNNTIPARSLLLQASSIVKHPIQKAMIADNLSSVYSEEGRHDEAITILKESIPLYDTTYNKRNLAYVYLNLAQLHFNKNTTNKISEQLLKKSFELNKHLNDKLLFKQIYRLRAQSDSAKGNFQFAFLNQNKYILYSDSILNSKRLESISEMQAAFDLEKKDYELQQHKQELKIHRHKLQRSYFILGMILALGTIGYILIRLFANKQKNLLVRQKLELMLSNKEKTIQLHKKQKQIETFLLRINEKNALLAQLQEKIEETESSPAGEKCEKIYGLLYSRLLTEDDWEAFRKNFISVYPDFYIHLTRNEYKFTPQEIRILMLLKLDYSGREIANTLGVALASVNTLRYRLRKKLNMDKLETLENFVQEI